MSATTKTANKKRRRGFGWRDFRIWINTQKREAKKKDDDDTVTWMDLLSATGTDLWILRQRALVENPKSNDAAVSLPVYRHQKMRVTIVGSTITFVAMESQGMDKREQEPTSDTSQSLTQVTGVEWMRQRDLIARQALSEVKELSLAAVDTVSWGDALRLMSIKQESDKHNAGMKQWQGSENGTYTVNVKHCAKANVDVVVDLKEMVIQVSLGWVTRLFGGHHDDDAEHIQLCTTFRQYWQCSRARVKDTPSLEAARTQLAQCIQGNHSSGLFQRIFRQEELTTRQKCSNCINAMVAAFDTTVVIVFWTIWNLTQAKSGDDGTWGKCRNDSADDERCANDLTILAELKQVATEGKVLDTTSLSYLGRAMMETLRVYPPVWTLPRVTSTDGQHVKLDVVWTNDALDRDWNPNHSRSCRLASFGLGKRHCPGGTAALFAAYRLLCRFVREFDAPHECKAGQTLRSLYLGPTLCMEGPQHFALRRAISSLAG